MGVIELVQVAVYIALLLVGVVWIMFRVAAYIRAERERESRLDQIMSQDEFKSYLQMLREQAKTDPPDLK